VSRLPQRSPLPVDIAEQHRFTPEDWAAASFLRKVNLAEEMLAEHHEHGGLCAGCLAWCRQRERACFPCRPPPPPPPYCAGCVWHKPYPCPLAVIAQVALCLPAVPR
jgi:hypothetical protein